MPRASMLAHADSHALIHPAAAVVIAVLASVVVAYTLGAARLRRSDPRGWPMARIVSFWTGALLLTWALVPAWLPLDEVDFHQHMLQHLMLGMFAPLALVLGAPLTLLFRTQPAHRVRSIASVLRRPWLRVLGHPGVLVVLVVGGLVVLYFTPLYALAEANELLHDFVHVHFFVSGYLFAWVIAGADPAPHRPSVPTRLVWIGLAILGHAVVAQLLYGGIGTKVPVAVAERRAAGDLMYYGGDIAELLLALAVVTTWHPRPAGRSGSAVAEADSPAGRAASGSVRDRFRPEELCTAKIARGPFRAGWAGWCNSHCAPWSQRPDSSSEGSTNVASRSSAGTLKRSDG